MKRKKSSPGKRPSNSQRFARARGLETQMLNRGQAKDAGPQSAITGCNDDDVATLLGANILDNGQGGPEIDTDNPAETGDL